MSMSIESGVVEIMTHPGFRGDSWDTFNCADDREIEMNVLCSNELYNQMNSMDSIQLTSYTSSCELFKLTL